MERRPRALFTHSVTPLKRKIKNFFFFSSSSSSPSLLFFFCFSFRFSLLHLLFFAEYLSLDEVLTMGKMRTLRIHRVVHVQQYPTFLSRTAHPPASRPQGPQRSRNASGDCPPSFRKTAARTVRLASSFTRVSRTVAHVHVHNRVTKELCGAQGPSTGRSPVEFLPIEGYVSRRVEFLPYARILLSDLSLYVRRLPRPPPFSRFVTRSSRS